MKFKKILEVFIIFLFCLDQAIKLLIPIQNKPENSGILFGSIEKSKPFLVISSFIALAIVAFFAFKSARKIPFYLILAGGVSNFIDRIRIGKVIDYFKIGNFSQFNLADLMIYAGIALILVMVYHPLEKVNEKKFLSQRKI